MVNHTREEQLLRTDVLLTCSLLSLHGPEARDLAAYSLRTLGFTPGAHVGRKLAEGSRETLEWYAGQLLSLCESRDSLDLWFAVEALLDQADHFTRELACDADRELRSTVKAAE
jgi:hypothetical protein